MGIASAPTTSNSNDNTNHANTTTQSPLEPGGLDDSSSINNTLSTDDPPGNPKTTSAADILGAAALLPPRDDSSSSSSCVQVAVRVRPLIALEGDDESCIQVFGASSSSLQIGGSTGPRFTFDQVWGTKTNQRTVYDSRVAPLIQSCLDGYNATILAYGQTGSGVSALSTRIGIL